MFARLVGLFRRMVMPEAEVPAKRPRQTSELVRLGRGAAKIQKVTSERLEYTTESGVDRFIDLPRSVKGKSKFPVVGIRRMLDDPPSVRFFDERSTRFEFANRDEAYESLILPLSNSGWTTLDAN